MELSLPQTEAKAWPLRMFRGLWKWLLGAFSCQNPLLALIGAGWGYRLARRSALKAWWKKRPNAMEGETFRQFARSHEHLQAFERTPSWFLAQDKQEHNRLVTTFHSLAINLWLGFRAWFHSLVFLAIPSSLMMFSWYSGWDNSFNKGYEQFDVGAMLGLFGVGLLIVVMLYLPMAQARFAVTQRVRSFYDFRLIRKVIRRQWSSCLWLVAGYALAGLPLMLAGSFLGVATATESLANLTPQEALAFLNKYYFVWGLYVFAAFVLLRAWAGRIYARGLLTCVQTGRIQDASLKAWEREAMQTCGLKTEAESAPKRSLLWTSNTLARVFAGGLASIAIWLTFAAQIYVTQFFAAQPELKRWGNHPLIQVPWFHHIPSHLKNIEP
jgi:hypothetical protein